MPSPSRASDRPRRVFSRFYARVSERMEVEGMAELRSELLAGEVVEVGAGNGMTSPTTRPRSPAWSPSSLSPLRDLATRAARTAPTPVTVRAGTADRLPLADGSVDAAVLCLVMCSLTDRAAALTELARVLRPGGVLRFLEHTLADTPGLRRVQRVADATVWPLLAGGCHTATDPASAITAAGF
ncbi:class I SAM-dependent methyltransferase [Pseudonocardia saturnea]